VILPVIDDGYCVQVLRGIDRILRQENLKVIISTYHNEADLEETLGSLCGEGRANAIILLNNTGLRPDKVRKLTGDSTPIVLLGQEDERTVQADIDSVLIDNFQGAYCAVEHLLEQQPKSLLLLTGPDCIFDCQERLKGAQKAIQDATCKPEVTILKGNFYQEEGRRVFAEHIRTQGTFPDAVFAFNDAMAFGVLDVLRDASRRVPEETQVIGFDGTIMAQSFGLSSVMVPMQQVGEEAVRLAVERIKGEDAKQVTMTLETRLIARKTTAARIVQQTGNGA
jgi:DNA-binding LacI/PurR family transcriptional regulator